MVSVFQKKPPKVIAEKPAAAGVLARTVLWYMTFTGFAVDHMVRININITIVDMIIPDDNSSRVRVSIERALMDILLIDYDKDGFSWNENHQAMVLGSFFWLYWVTQIPGGMLARRFGAKKVFGYANLTASLLCFVMPAMAFIDKSGLVAIRVAQGMICGLSWPAMHTMIAQWIPPDERGEFISAYYGSSFGVAVFYPLFGFLISMTSWEWSYYLSGFIGTMWFVFWQYFVYETPAHHPRIDRVEREYIEMSLGDSYAEISSLPTPWCSILTSGPVWLIAISQWGGTWCSTTLLTQGPTYFSRILKWSLLVVGLLTGLPHLLKFLFSLAFSKFADRMIHTERLSMYHTRRMAGAFCYLGQGFFALCLAYSGLTFGLPLVFYSLAAAASGAETVGPRSNLIDLSPNFASIVVGAVEMVSASTMYLSPLLVGALTLDNPRAHEPWQYVFVIAAVVCIVCGVPYVCWSSSSVQTWNGHDMLADISELDDLGRPVHDLGAGGVYRARATAGD